MSPEEILKKAREVLAIEIEGLATVREKLGEEFVRAVEMLSRTRGRVVVTGIGKSGLIGRKIVATLASLGTPALFLHPAEALHGDLGMVVPGDIILAISNSGKTEEINVLLPIIKGRGARIIALTGRPDSPLARAADIVIDCGVPREACPLGLAPTASTTATLAVGDALAVALLALKDFSEQDFRRNHPGGTLGERLKVRVAEIMLTGKAVPRVSISATMPQAIEEMNKKGLGCVLVLTEDGRLEGIITDGDLRRAISRYGEILSRKVTEIMTLRPKTVYFYCSGAEALETMERHLITVLPVVDDQGHLVGILHLHDILGKGEFKFVL
ncbi:KpsF/GutQ family sugar-phosphate isomerase [Thermosulfuriphilus sp.]